jgi:hypothetical protein
MARHHGNHSLLPEMVQPNNEQLNQPLPLGSLASLLSIVLYMSEL